MPNDPISRFCEGKGINISAISISTFAQGKIGPDDQSVNTTKHITDLPLQYYVDNGIPATIKTDHKFTALRKNTHYRQAALKALRPLIASPIPEKSTTIRTRCSSLPEIGSAWGVSNTEVQEQARLAQTLRQASENLLEKASTVDTHKDAVKEKRCIAQQALADMMASTQWSKLNQALQEAIMQRAKHYKLYGDLPKAQGTAQPIETLLKNFYREDDQYKKACDNLKNAQNLLETAPMLCNGKGQPTLLYRFRVEKQSSITWENNGNNHKAAGYEGNMAQLLNPGDYPGEELKPILSRHRTYPWIKVVPQAYYDALFGASIMALPIVANSDAKTGKQHIVGGKTDRISKAVALIAHRASHDEQAAIESIFSPAHHIRTWAILSAQNKCTPPPADHSPGLKIGYRWKQFKYGLKKFLYHDQWDYPMAIALIITASILALSTLAISTVLSPWMIWLGPALTNIHYFATTLISISPVTLLLWGLVLSFILSCLAGACDYYWPSTGMSTRSMKAEQDFYINTLRKNPAVTRDIIDLLLSGKQLTLWCTQEYPIDDKTAHSHCQALLSRLTHAGNLSDYIDLRTEDATATKWLPSPKPKHSKNKVLNALLKRWHAFNYYVQYELKEKQERATGMARIITSMLKSMLKPFIWLLTRDIDTAYQRGEKTKSLQTGSRERLAYQWWHNLCTIIQEAEPSGKADPNHATTITPEQYETRLDLCLLALVDLNGGRLNDQDATYITRLLDQRPRPTGTETSASPYLYPTTLAIQHLKNNLRSTDHNLGSATRKDCTTAQSLAGPSTSSPTAPLLASAQGTPVVAKLPGHTM